MKLLSLTTWYYIRAVDGSIRLNGAASPGALTILSWRLLRTLQEILLRRVTQSKCFNAQYLPKTWLETPISKLVLIPDYFDLSAGFIDPLEFLLSLSFGSSRWPSTKQLLQVMGVCQITTNGVPSRAPVEALGT